LLEHMGVLHIHALKTHMHALTCYHLYCRKRSNIIRPEMTVISAKLIALKYRPKIIIHKTTFI